ncbi:MAG: thioredoxin domain-containing protein [Candidatus Marinimicrobia bacterium]|nr:thioredoxin domain-containing protein [Candidatus Neomarinimicrobiota bacterium]
MNRKTLTAVIMIMLIAFTAVSCGNKKTDTSKTTASASLPKLLDLGAESCAPCKMMAPILDELREEYRGVMEVVFIDVWKRENQQEATKYGIRRHSHPDIF